MNFARRLAASAAAVASLAAAAPVAPASAQSAPVAVQIATPATPGFERTRARGTRPIPSPVAESTARPAHVERSRLRHRDAPPTETGSDVRVAEAQAPDAPARGRTRVQGTSFKM